MTAGHSNPYPLTVFFDGECPICAREIALLKRLNRKNRVHFVDFAEPAFDPKRAGFGREELAQVIHARWADGSVVIGVDVFREVWTALGFGLLARVSRLPFIDRVLAWGYDWFARNRLWLTGRKGAEHADEQGRGHSDPGSCPRCTDRRRAG